MIPGEWRLWLALALAAWLLTAPALGDQLASRFGLAKTNFLGNTVLCSNGLAILLFALPTLALEAMNASLRQPALTMLWTTAAFGLLGFIDDRWGDRSVSGLGGHLKALIREKKLTTGLLKAAGGLAASILIVRFSLAEPWFSALLGGCVVALSANALNLLDLRPGRAGFSFLAGVYAVAIWSLAGARTASLLPIFAVAIPAARVQRRDSLGKAMLGDTGANLLGGALGLAIVLESRSHFARLFYLFLLIGLHLLAERASLTSLIERSRLLRSLDRLTGIRDPSRNHS